MIKSAAGAASYLVSQANRRAELRPWFEGIIDGAGLGKGTRGYSFAGSCSTMARKQAGQVLRRRDTREHVALYLKAFNAWHTTNHSPSCGSPPARKCPASPKPAELGTTHARYEPRNAPKPMTASIQQPSTQPARAALRRAGLPEITRHHRAVSTTCGRPAVDIPPSDISKRTRS